MNASATPDPAGSGERSTGSPFFTVLIPTMNRPRLLEAAVRSVLWQTFGDFELVVSDNSNDQASIARNGATMRKHGDDARVRCIRPGSWMNMPDHWEFATRHARGRYVVILTDRHVMRPGALEVLRSRITQLQEDAQVVSWHTDSSFGASGAVVTGAFSGGTEVVESKKLIGDFAKMAQWRRSPLWVNRLPRMLNSCYRSDVAHAIRERHGRLFLPVSPDYTAAYLLLAYTHRVAYLDLPLFMNHGNESNGKRSLVYGDEAYVSSLGDVDLFLGTPARLRTITNSLVRDLMMVKDLVGDRYADVTPDTVGYYMCNYRELLHMQRLGSVRDVRALYAQWWEGVRMLGPGQQQQIAEHVGELEKERAPFTRLRRQVVRMGLYPLYQTLAGAARRLRHRLAGDPVYADVLEAARRTDGLIAPEGESRSIGGAAPRAARAGG